MTMTMWLLVWAVLLTTSSTALEVPDSFEASPWTLRPHRVLTDKVRRLDDGVSEHFELHRMSSTRESWVRGEKASLTTHHEVMIAVKQANLDKLDIMLQERSTPGTPLYRQWMSFEEIGAVTANPTALAAIKTWLQESNIHISWVSPREEYILASAPISTWNKVLKTEFFEYHDTHEYSSLVLQRQGLKGRQGAASASSSSSSYSATEDKVTLLRAEQCFVPSHISDHIVGIFHTTQAPAILNSKSATLSTAPSAARMAPDQAGADAELSEEEEEEEVISTSELLQRELAERLDAKVAAAEGFGSRPMSPLSAAALEELGQMRAKQLAIEERARARRALAAQKSQAARGALRSRGGSSAAPLAGTVDAASLPVAEADQPRGEVRSMAGATVTKAYQATCTQAFCVNPMFLKNIYNISLASVQSSKSTQAVFATGGQTYSLSDSATFAARFNVSTQSFKGSALNGMQLDLPCTTNGLSVCQEANLDMQYIMGMAVNARTYFDYRDATIDFDVFLIWIYQAVNSPTPGLVHSISYGALEIGMDQTTLYTFTVEAMKLAAMGVTVVAASGDNGAAGTYNGICLCSLDTSSDAYKRKTATPAWTNMNQTWTSMGGYMASFPASCPYVTAVGGTSNMPTLPSPWCNFISNGARPFCSKIGNTYYVKDIYRRVEFMADSNPLYSFSSITSGGGFSAYWDRPAWQRWHVDKYVNNNVSSNRIPTGFNEQGRGYPDVSFGAHNYEVVIGGSSYLIDGTSASAPVFAGMLTLINGVMLKHGLPVVGFINPTLYTKEFATQYTDIDDSLIPHVNSCCGLTTSGTTCCKESSGQQRDIGFPVASGWDAATGLGSIGWTRLYRLFNVAGTYPPSPVPTQKPSNPSAVPTLRPSFAPTDGVSPEWVAVTSKFSGVSYATFVGNSAAQNKLALRSATAAIASLPVDRVNIESISDASSRRLASSSSSPHPPASLESAGRWVEQTVNRLLGSSQISVTFIINANVTGIGKDFIVSSLTSATADGSYAASIYKYASSVGALGMLSLAPVAGSLSVEERVPSFSPTVKPDRISYTVILIACVAASGSVFLIVSCALLYRFGWLDRICGIKGSHKHNVCGLASDVSEVVAKGGNVYIDHPLDPRTKLGQRSNLGSEFPGGANDDWRSVDSASSFGIDIYATEPTSEAQARRDAIVAANPDLRANKSAGWRVTTAHIKSRVPDAVARLGLTPQPPQGPVEQLSPDQQRRAVAASRTAGWKVTGNKGSDLHPIERQALGKLSPDRVMGLEQGTDKDPSEFLCPISNQIMRDPHIAADGMSYEKANIQAHFQKGATPPWTVVSPVTGQPLKHTNLWPNAQLRNSIERYLRDRARQAGQERQVGRIDV